MTIFAKLTDATTGKEVWVNPALVLAIFPGHAGTVLCFASQAGQMVQGLIVKEAIGVVVATLAG
jgi:hypothetical protein